MGELIDKAQLRKELSKLPSEMGFVRKSDVMNVLGSQKPAFNADSVIEDLKKYFGMVKNCSVDYAEGLKDGYERAIDIVRCVRGE